MSRCGRAAPLAACSLVLTLLASCQAGTDRTTPAGHGGGAQGGTVVVASFNFPESELLAAIYELAIRHAGIPAQLQLDLGTARTGSAGPGTGPGGRGSRISRDRADQPRAPSRRPDVGSRGGPGRAGPRAGPVACPGHDASRGPGPERHGGHRRHRPSPGPAHGQRPAAGRQQADSRRFSRMPGPAVLPPRAAAGIRTPLRQLPALRHPATARRRASRRRGRRRGAGYHRREPRHRRPGPARRRPPPAARGEHRAQSSPAARWRATESGWPTR